MAEGDTLLTNRDTRHAPDCGVGHVRVATQGRLHLGFLDPSATLGRRFGSLGLVVGGPRTVVELSWHDGPDDHIEAPDDERARLAAHLRALRQALGAGNSPGQAPARSVHLRLVEALASHAGLGSGTQLALATGRAFAELHRLSPTTLELARWLGRGLRFGVGIAGFDRGGFILDAGPAPHAADHQVAPVLAHLAFPAPWRILLVRHPGVAGLHGQAEREALRTLAPFPQSLAAQLCHETLMRVLPALHERDFAAFARGIGQIQATIATYFAPAQGGVYSSAAVGRLLNWLHAAGHAGVGQSSWGPTGFVFFDSAAAAEAALADARSANVVDPALALEIVAGWNESAAVHHVPLAGWHGLR